MTATAAAPEGAPEVERRPEAALSAAVWSALGGVRDPELDESVTELGFVAACELREGDEVVVRLRLPTYFCAPNFAYLMVADAFEAVEAVPGVSRVTVVLDDHFAAEAINAGVAAGEGFVASFAGLAEAELDQLRVDFLRKAVLAATDGACGPLLRGGHRPAQLAGLTLGDLPPSPERDRLRARRAELGLPSGDEAALVVDPASGAAVEGPALALHLRKARLVRVSIEANAAVCRGLLGRRYPDVAVRIRRSGANG